MRSYRRCCILGRRAGAALQLVRLVESRHPKTPHYYLGGLGTDPEWQGKGLASAVIGPVLDICDREGLPAYLESSKESNVEFYRRHGFEVIDVRERARQLGPPLAHVARTARRLAQTPDDG